MLALARTLSSNSDFQGVQASAMNNARTKIASSLLEGKL